MALSPIDAQAVRRFGQILESGEPPVTPYLMVRLCFIAEDYGRRLNLTENEISGIVTGAVAMFQALADESTGQASTPRAQPTAPAEQ